MFEITSDDIALLNDEDLRTLVGRLCESEVRKRGFSPAAVMWGGHQNATDGGLDVRVALTAGAKIDGFVPRSATGFQVRKSDMPRKKILAEMRPHSVLRSVIRELADREGAYIIVSSAGSTSDTILQKRRDAMREAIKELPNAHSLNLDFYDRKRLETWVRDHPGLIPWVRERIGKAIDGWHPYKAWAYSPEGISDEYLMDDSLRIHTDTEATEGGLRPLEGIRRIRERLRGPGKVVRLVGLSGVGKTRLVQALFDDRIGDNGLDPSLAYYTDMADEPDPLPTTLASNLIAARTRAILIIDNCHPDLHRRLSEACRSLESTVSLITVEYDIREDQPEGTEIFSLEPSSVDLIDKLVKRRFRDISPIDARTVAEFSGGNARIAITLAETIKHNETIAGLSDDDLIRRLIEQRHGSNESILLAAQVLSLVYSFQGEDISSGDQAELFRLGAIIGRNARDMFGLVAELRQRNLIQRRGVWRAVLPHAIANRLAATALQRIPFPEIEGGLINGAPERLLRSFSRRLGYLNASEEAQSIVRQWLGAGGILAHVVYLTDLGAAMLNNIAPIAPEATLGALERALLEPKSEHVAQKCRRYIPLLRSLAYDPELFERCIALISILAETDDVNADGREPQKVFASLFWIHLSGTHARIEQRLVVIRSLLKSDDQKRRTLGAKALEATLQTAHFSAPYNFEVGARSRDYGYWPRTRDEVKHWSRSALQFAEDFACTDGPLASQIRKAIADQFRGLWTWAAMFDELEQVCRTISAKRFWPEGWIAVRHIIHFDSSSLGPEIRARLASLDELLRPKELVQKVRSIVLSESLVGVSLDSGDDGSDDIHRAYARIEALAQELGKAASADADVFSELLAELVSGRGQLWSFGRGIAEGAEDHEAIWKRLVTQLAATPEDKRQIQVFLGFLNKLQALKPDLANLLLDDAVENEPLASFYPVLQTAIGLNKEGLDRLMRSLSVGKAPISIYQYLSWGRATDPVSGQDLRRLILEIAAKPGGFDPAVDILYMRLHSSQDRESICTSEIIDAGCELMRQLAFTKKNHRQEHRLGVICKNCLVGKKGATIVQEICGRLKASISKYETSIFYHDDLLEGLFSAQPIAALEGFCPVDTADANLDANILDYLRELRTNPFRLIPENDLLSWCDQQPKSRYPAVAAAVNIFHASPEPWRTPVVKPRPPTVGPSPRPGRSA